MVNPTQLTEYPLAGKGHTRHPRRGYAPGELRTLANCEILDDGSLVNRRPVGSIDTSSPDPITTEYQDMDGFVGNYKHGAIIAGNVSQKLLIAHDQQSLALFSPTEFQTGLDTVNGEWRKIVAFHRYNKTNYWITCAWFYNGGSANCKVEYAVYWAKDPVGGDITGIVFGDLTKAVIFTTTDTATDSNNPDGTENGSATPVVTPETFPQFKASFIHKDRLWLFTDLKAYFSKTGDPTIWLAPDGGMFNFLEHSINDAVGHKDSIYIACDSSIFILTYTSDPNTNSTLRQLSSSQGGDSICLSGDTIYFARDDGLFSVSDQSISRVLELDIFNTPISLDPNSTSPNLNSFEWRLLSVNDYIVAWLVHSVDCRAVNWPEWVKFDPKDSSQWADFKFYHQVSGFYNGSTDPQVDVQYGVFFINTKNGSLHAFSITQTAYFQDFYFVTTEDYNDNQVLYFLTESGGYDSGTITPDKHTAHWPHYMIMASDELDYTLVFDRVQISDTVNNNVPVPWVVEISDYAPDASEMFLKRFRSLVVEGDIRYYVELYIAYDNMAFNIGPDVLIYGVDADAIASATNMNRNPIPTRYPLNQKAKSISIKLRRGRLTPEAIAVEGEHYSGVSIRTIALFWTPSSHGISTRGEALAAPNPEF